MITLNSNLDKVNHARLFTCTLESLVRKSLIQRNDVQLLNISSVLDVCPEDSMYISLQVHPLRFVFNFRISLGELSLMYATTSEGGVYEVELTDEVDIKDIDLDKFLEFFESELDKVLDN